MSLSVCSTGIPHEYGENLQMQMLHLVGFEPWTPVLQGAMLTTEPPCAEQPAVYTHVVLHAGSARVILSGYIIGCCGKPFFIFFNGNVMRYSRDISSAAAPILHAGLCLLGCSDHAPVPTWQQQPITGLHVFVTFLSSS